MKSSKLSNYIIAIITSVIYASVTYSSLIPHLYISSFLNHPVLAFIISMIAPLFISSIIAALITFINKKEFSIIFVWATVILSFMSSMGQSYLVKSWLETENLENTIKNLDDKILDYEKNILEEKSLRLIFDDLIDEHQNLLNDHDIQNEDLQKKDSVINQLNKEIEDLLDTKKDLKQAREKIITLQNISKKYFAQVDSLLGKTEELQTQNINLITENTQIKIQNKDLSDSIVDANKRLDEGSTLEVFDVEIEPLKINDKGQTRPVLIYIKNIQILRCEFKVAKNITAEEESKSVYLLYVSPKGKVLLYKDTGKVPFFNIGDSTVSATVKHDFNYIKNKDNTLYVDWEREDPLEKGEYKVLFFIEGKNVGESSFTLPIKNKP